MCFDSSARAPTPPRTGHLTHSERLVLTSGDGTRFAARLPRTTEEDAPRVVLLPDVRGLHPYCEDLADRFADAGAHALAVDLYAPTAGAEYRDESFDFAPHRAAATDRHIRRDVRAAALALREAGASRTFVLGFCFGGWAALMQASQQEIDG